MSNNRGGTRTARIALVVAAAATVLMGAAPTGAAKGGRWVHNVTGEGVSGSGLLAFNARIDADGNVKGRVDWRFHDGRPASFGEVVCLEVRGNRAYLAYVAEGGELGGYGDPGNPVLFSVIDNGEGSKATGPDANAYIYYGHSNCVFHADFIDNDDPANGSGFPLDWSAGNLQVR